MNARTRTRIRVLRLKIAGTRKALRNAEKVGQKHATACQEQGKPA